MRRVDKIMARFLPAVLLFDIVRARYVMGGDADAGSLPPTSSPSNPLFRFFEGEPFPAAGAALAMPIDWLLLILPLVAGCAYVIEELFAPRSLQAVLRLATRRRAWLRTCGSLAFLVACWLAACVASTWGVCSAWGRGGPLGLGLSASGPAQLLEILALEASVALLVVSLQACVSVAFGATAGAAASFCLGALSCVSRCAWLPFSWMMLARSPWFLVLDLDGAQAAIAMLACALSAASLLAGGLIYARRDLIPTRRIR